MKHAALPLAAAITIILMTSGCNDPEREALRIFHDQGLTLLRPARSYVTAGGLVVLPRGGHPEYLDPFDQMPSEPGTYVDFKAIIAGETYKKSTGFSVALNGLGKVVSLPADLTYSGAQDVQLSQIETSGKRLVTGVVNALIAKKATGEAIHQQLAQGNRVFVVQEIYTGTGIELKSSTKTILDASYGTKGSVPNCASATAEPDTTKGEGSKSAPPASSSAATSKDSPAAEKPNSDTKAPQSNADAKQKGPSAKSSAAANKQATTGSGVSIGACKSTAYSLTLKSKDDIPFAVRLNEVILGNGGLVVNYGSFQFPQSLGNAEVEQATTFIDPSHPVLEELVYRHL